MTKKKSKGSVDLNVNKVISLDSLQNHIGEITKHAAVCKEASDVAIKGEAPIVIVTELSIDGLASTLIVKCKGCGMKFNFETSKNMKMEDGTFRKEINVRAVWGTMASGWCLLSKSVDPGEYMCTRDNV